MINVYKNIRFLIKKSKLRYTLADVLNIYAVKNRIKEGVGIFTHLKRTFTFGLQSHASSKLFCQRFAQS